MRVPKYHGDPARPISLAQPGEWFRWANHPGATLHVAMRCPTCTLFFSLEDHAVATGGQLAPSVVCPHKPCSFHEFIVLDEWAA